MMLYKRRVFLRNAATTAAGAMAIPSIIPYSVFGEVTPDNNSSNRHIQDKIDWESYLGRHDLIWERTPDDYSNAPFAGNGMLGAMIYRLGFESLRLDIGRMDVVEHRDTEARSVVDNGRLPVGYFSFETNASFNHATGRLDLFNAEIALKGNYRINRTTSTQLDFRILVFHQVDAIMVEYEKPGGLQYDWVFHPEPSVVPRTPIEGSRHLNPQAEVNIVDGIKVCVQKRDSGGCYVTAWTSLDAGHGTSRLLVTVQDSYPGNEAVDTAIEIIKTLSKEGEVEKQQDLHRKWWNAFYQASFVSVPDVRMEGTYWIQQGSNLIYLCYYLWEYYRITMNEAYLRTHLFPLLKRAVNLILHEVTIDSDGIIHTPFGHSPESTHDYDTNYDLSSLKWGCQTLLKINDHLNLMDALEEKWKHVAEKLLPFPQDENGYMCSVNESAPLMHRHWCHLFMIYPYYTVNWEQPESQDVILRSVKHWGSPEIPNTWTQAAISSMYSSIRDGENAFKHMQHALESPHYHPNTFHFEGARLFPCSETYGGLCRMLQDMLIQSWGDKIRIFPGVSATWKDVVFHKLRAEGGFEVSALRKNGETSWIRIKSLAGEPCMIEPGFAESFHVKGAKVQLIQEGLYSIDLSQGEEVMLYTPDSDQFIVEQLESDTSEYNFYGLKNA